MATTRRGFLTRAAAAGGGLAVLPALAACGGPAAGPGGSTGAVKLGDPVTVTFWHSQSGNNEKALNEIVQKFNSTNGKNITLNAEFQSENYTDIYRKVMASIQAGSPPDTAVAYESMVVDYMKANAVVDLDDYALKGPQAFSKESLADIFPAYVEANKYPMYNNKLLSFPFTKSLAVMYADEDLYKAAGIAKYGLPGQFITFDDFKKQMAALSKKGADGKPSVYGHHIRLDTSYIDAFIYANQGDLLNKEQTKVRFNEGPGLEVFEMWDKMVKDGQAYAVTDRTYQTDFASQKSASFHDSSTRIDTLTDLVDKAPTKFKWSAIMLPQKDPNKPSTVMFGGNIAVFKTTPLKQAACWEWIKFFMERDQTAEWAARSSYMPTRKSAADHPAIKQLWEKRPQQKQAYDLAQYSKPEPQIPAWQEVRDILANALTAVTTQKLTPKQALDDAAKNANKVIEDAR